MEAIKFSLDESAQKRNFLKTLEKDGSFGEMEFKDIASQKETTFKHLRTASLDVPLSSNPFVDKSSIPEHQRKIKNLIEKNERLYKIYNNAAALSAFDQQVLAEHNKTNLSQFTADKRDFQTKLDDLANQKKRQLKMEHFDMTQANLSLGKQKSLTRQQVHELNRLADLEAAKKDSKVAAKLKNEELQYERVKKQQFMQTLNDFSVANRQAKDAMLVKGMKPQEIALNRRRISGIEDPEILDTIHQTLN